MNLQVSKKNFNLYNLIVKNIFQSQRLICPSICLVWHCLVWHCLVWISVVWICLAWICLVWICLVWICLVWICLVWICLVWICLVWICLELVLFEFVLFKFVLFEFVLFKFVLFEFVLFEFVLFEFVGPWFSVIAENRRNSQKVQIHLFHSFFINFSPYPVDRCKSATLTVLSAAYAVSTCDRCIFPFWKSIEMT